MRTHLAPAALAAAVIITACATTATTTGRVLSVTIDGGSRTVAAGKHAHAQRNGHHQR